MMMLYTSNTGVQACHDHEKRPQESAVSAKGFCFCSYSCASAQVIQRNGARYLKYKVPPAIGIDVPEAQDCVHVHIGCCDSSAVLLIEFEVSAPI